jgi:excisionase family DNA binding protein
MTTVEHAIDAVEAGKILGIHPRTVIRRAKANEIPAFQTGKYWRFLPSVLDAWMREQIEQRMKRET